MANLDLLERIQKGESAIAKAKAQGRDVAQWERHLESLKLETERLFLGSQGAKTLSCDLEAGEIVAVEIASEVLGADIWLAFRANFNPSDGIPVFYPDELQHLKDKSVETLRKIYETKKAFGPGTRVRQ